VGVDCTGSDDATVAITAVSAGGTSAECAIRLPAQAVNTLRLMTVNSTIFNIGIISPHSAH
jgi:hypothetical protein